MNIRNFCTGLLLFLSIVSFGFNPSDSIRKILNNATSDSAKIRYTLELGDLYYDTKPDTAFFYYLKVLNLTQQKIKTNPTYFIKNKYAEALYSTGYIYNGQGNIKQALENYYQSLKIRESINDTSGIAYSSLVIGNVFLGQGDIKKALESYIKCEKLFLLLKDNRGLAIIYNNLGYCYSHYQENEKAIIYFKKCLALNNQDNDQAAKATSTNNIGMMYFNSKNYKEAIRYFEEAIEIIKKQNDLGSLSLYHKNIGSSYLKLNENKKAEKYFNESYSLAKQIGFPSSITGPSLSLYELHKSKNDYKNALKYYEEYVLMSDSIDNETARKASFKQQVQYDYEKQKTIDNARYEKQLAVEKEAKAKQSVIIYAIAVGLGLLVIFLSFVFNRLQVTKRQKNVIETQKIIVENAHHELEVKNQEIMDSITYAKRIQSAILPPKKIVKEYLQDSFILYKPKDIVAGDFYWLEHKNNKILFAAADCTGHGVPGAMVSVVCVNGLNRSVREHGLTDPGEILDKTREIVIQEFEKSEEDVKDGMDISLCVLDDKKLLWAGANNPLWIYRPSENVALNKTEYELIELKPNKQPIGKYSEEKPFTTHKIELHKGDAIYIFTDGYHDQFGGERGKKFKAAKLRELLLSIQHEPMEKQREIIDHTFEQWKGNLEQVDDVCIIGVKI